MNTKAIAFILICLSSLLPALNMEAVTPQKASLKLGAERMDVITNLLANKRVALIVNQTSILEKEQKHLLDVLLEAHIQVKKVFAPEHGFRGVADAGATVDNSRDVKTGLPIISLYGKNKKPTAEQLSDIDVVVFDIQDVGTRFYTYISTMSEEQCNNVFERFYKGNEFAQGTGLGLAICQNIATKMNGKISVTSKPGIGSCFSVNFPCTIVNTIL